MGWMIEFMLIGAGAKAIGVLSIISIIYMLTHDGPWHSPAE